MSKANKQAFPRPASKIEGADGSCANDGLSKREYFAGQALAGLLANSDYCYHSHPGSDEVANDCVNHADALIARLEAGNETD